MSNDRVQRSSRSCFDPLQIVLAICTLCSSTNNDRFKKLKDDDDASVDGEVIARPSISETVPSNSKGKFKNSDIKNKANVKVKEDYHVPTKRSAEEIKAAYGRTSGEVLGTAALARDKLLERQEKLEALGKHTKELNNEAENFASLTAELAKAMEAKKRPWKR